jgi:hypothetical protein
LVILECSKAFENTELSPWNTPDQLPGGRQRLQLTEGHDAGPVNCIHSFGDGSYPNSTPDLLSTHAPLSTQTFEKEVNNFPISRCVY